MKRIVRQRIIGICLIVVAAMAGTVEAAAQDTRTQEAKRDRLQKEIAILDGQIKANATQSANALSQLTLVRKKVDSRKALVQESDREIAGLTSAIRVKEKEINDLQARLDTLSEHYTQLVRSAYKNRNAKIWFMYILASENLSQGVRRYGYLRDLSKQMNIQAEKIGETKERLEGEKAELSELRTAAQKLRDERQAEMSKVQAEEAQSQSLVNQLNKDKRKYQKDLARKQREVEALNREIERIIREATSEKSSGSTASGGTKKTEIDYALAKQFEANKGKLPWPVDGPVVDPYGQRYHPVYKNVKLPFNNGVTIAVSPGTSAQVVFDGVVKQIVVMPGYNKCVLVQHGSFFTFYCKLSSVGVKAGDKLKTGDTIGLVDTIGGETQLHFEIWSGRNPQNPAIWLKP